MTAASLYDSDSRMAPDSGYVSSAGSGICSPRTFVDSILDSESKPASIDDVLQSVNERCRKLREPDMLTKFRENHRSFLNAGLTTYETCASLDTATNPGDSVRHLVASGLEIDFKKTESGYYLGKLIHYSEQGGEPWLMRTTFAAFPSGHNEGQSTCMTEDETTEKMTTVSSINYGNKGDGRGRSVDIPVISEYLDELRRRRKQEGLEKSFADGKLEAFLYEVPLEFEPEIKT